MSPERPQRPSGAHLCELLAPLLRELRHVDPDDLAVVARVEAEAGVDDRILDVLQTRLVKGLDDERASVRRGHGREVLQWRGGAVVLDGDAGKHGRHRAACTRRGNAFTASAGVPVATAEAGVCSGAAANRAEPEVAVAGCRRGLLDDTWARNEGRELVGCAAAVQHVQDAQGCEVRGEGCEVLGSMPMGRGAHPGVGV